ncbi:hypothetical protein [Paenibacillus montanisoli]|uniref:Uncharacterized protein n=1 Tax=Paenibacillus montanisoli TaxID=2081970 RepID=A0A328U6M3_9BACL|nr:hypothetical protein [Paenibacillus montanisoli]RAP76605.1 hypothetical protein DL346_14675 [Paenibacillus montanisoli]
MNLFSTLTAWSPSTGLLSYEVDGVPQSSEVQALTNIHRAAINQYIPNDPVLPIVARWNALVDAQKGQAVFGPVNPPVDIPNPVNEVTGDLADEGAFMQIHLDSFGVVASLRPIPFIPPNPVIPPNPI